MEDEKIVELYWKRDTQAISETAAKYGKYCGAIAVNILGNTQDAEECVNDTYMNAWNSMPPNRPKLLQAFVGRITRNLAFNRYKYNCAEKRGGTESFAILNELEECVSGEETVDNEVYRREIINSVNDFLNKLPDKKHDIFILRYWYAESVNNIGKRFEMKPNAVSMTLKRLRCELQSYLLERGFEI